LIHLISRVRCNKHAPNKYIPNSEPEPGVELVSEGEVKGTDIWYFAYKEGIFVKTVTNGTADVTATATAQGITIPMKRVFQNELKLVK